MTSTAVRDKKIALTQRRITDAQAAAAKHREHLTRLAAEIDRHQQTLDWLKAMPIDDTPPTTLEETDQ